MTEHDTRKAALLAEKARLEKHMLALEGQLDAPAPKDFEDRASERQGDEVLEALGDAEQTELRMIEAALQRIEDGTYGVCANCGADIPSKRLDLLPYTPVCPRCAA